MLTDALLIAAVVIIALGVAVAPRMWPQPRKKRLPKARHRAITPREGRETTKVVFVWREDERRG